MPEGQDSPGISSTIFAAACRKMSRPVEFTTGASGLELLARGARLFVEDFLGFLHRSAFAKLSIILVRFASAILESLSFPVYVYEWVGVLLIFHDVLPLARILLFGASIHAA